MGKNRILGRASATCAALGAAFALNACSSSPSGGAPIVACQAGLASVMHTTNVTSEEVWGAGTHIVPSSLSVTMGGHLTISPCADVRLGTGASITVTTSAVGLDAVGTAAQPISFERNAGAAWGNIAVTAPAAAHLAYATLTGGGTGAHDSAAFGGATLVAQGPDPQRPIVLTVQNVIVSGSGGLGVMMRGARFDPSSTALTITASGWYPLYLGIGSAGDIPSGSYSNNAIDQILLQSFNTAVYVDDGPLLADVTISNRGVPYRVGTIPSSIIVGDGKTTSPTASLTIQPGVTMLFTPEGTGAVSQLLVNGATDGTSYKAQGALIIAGTVAAPVILDSPAAGDWQGIYFSRVVDPRSSIANARILDAGGFSGTVGICPSTPAGNNGAATCSVIISVQTAPTSFITGSVFGATTCGVYRGWSMGDVDFTSNNQFMSVTGCSQTSLPKPDGACDPCMTAP